MTVTKELTQGLITRTGAKFYYRENKVLEGAAEDIFRKKIRAVGVRGGPLNLAKQLLKQAKESTQAS